MAQILISAAISSLISLVIINHEIVEEKFEDIADWKRREVREVWHIKEFLLEFAVPAAAGVLGSFVGLGIAHWLGIV